MTICQTEDCDRTVAARGWCRMHYRRWRKAVVDFVPLNKSGDFLDARGYVRRADRAHPLAHSAGTVLVHRVVLLDKIGPGIHPCHHCGKPVDWAISHPTPGALVVDHLDGVRSNNDPANLVPSCAPCNSHNWHNHSNGRKTHCTICGGEYHLKSNGHRSCRVCDARRQRGYDKAKRAAASMVT